VAVSITDDGGNRDIWTVDLGRKVRTRVTFDQARDSIPVWSPNGSQIAFDSDRSGIRQLYRANSSGEGKEEQLTSGSNSKNVLDWSRDGRFLLYMESAPGTGSDVWALPLDNPRAPMVVLQTPFSESSATFSPDGKWIAYTSNATGRSEVYVRAFPPSPDRPWPVSNQGGSRPRWRADGGSLYFLEPAQAGQQSLVAASVQASGARFETGAPHELFKIDAVLANLAFPFDVSRDGQRFLIYRASSAVGPPPLTVVTDWRAQLKK
jgi:serine/threonine-protein kinase